MRKINWKRGFTALAVAIAASAAPAVGPDEARAGVSASPSPATAGQSITIRSDRAGVLHWGVDRWQEPTNAWPTGTHRAFGALETPLVPRGADHAVTVGPFPAGVAELNFVIRYADGTWDSDGGRDYRVAIAGASATPPGAITIGRGPSIGWSGGEEYFEELQDWVADDVRSLDYFDDGRALHDGQDRSRDIVAFYSRRTADTLFLRLDFLDLALGAERGGLNCGILIDFQTGGQRHLPSFVRETTAHPWELAVLVRDADEFVIYDAQWNTVASPRSNAWVSKGAYFRSDLDAVETGIDLQALRWKGWDGRSPLRFQVYTWKDGTDEVNDAVAEADLFDGALDEQIAETDRGSTAKYSVILHGNQSISSADHVADLIRNHRIQTPSGRPTGYHRALETHSVFDVKVNIHVSGSLAATLEWAQHPDPAFDGPSFNRWIGAFLDADPDNGDGALIGGTYSEHIMPYFEHSGVNESSARLKEETLRRVYGQPSPPSVFWTPERVIRAETFADIRSAGYGWTVVDQFNHLWQWYGRDDALGNNGFKINRINGVDCFIINDEPDQKKFGTTDGGTFIDTRYLLLGKAFDPDQEQLVLVFDDWEAFSGRSFTSFGTGSDNPDNYDAHIRWLGNHPWVQVVTLEEVASWGWTPVDRGQRSDLGLETYHWLQHAVERSYDSWYFGSPQEEGFRDLIPTLRRGQNASKIFGDVWTPGTLLRDVWDDVRGAPAGNLKTLAEMTYASMVFETAWHDEDRNNYHPRTGDQRNDYLDPDTTYDRIAGWAIGLHNHVKDAAIVARAAHWAAGSPARATRAYALDVDHDGEREHVIENDRVYAVFENDGGRLIAMFARELATGEAFSVIGALPVNPGDSREAEWEGDRNGSQRRVSGLKDWWSTGRSTSGYVNDIYSVTTASGGLRFTSSDGRIRKTITLAAGSSRLEARYETDPSVGRLYVRSGLSPHITELAMSGQQSLRATRSGNRYELASDHGVRVGIAVEVHGSGASLHDHPDDGSAASPRTVALTHQVEASGERDFRVVLDATVRR